MGSRLSCSAAPAYRSLASAVHDSQEAVKIALVQYQAGTILFTQVTQLELALVAQQDALAQARREEVSGLIQVYRALGGGWQIRLDGCHITPLQPPRLVIVAGR